MKNQTNQQDLIDVLIQWFAAHISDIGFLLVASIMGALITWIFYRRGLVGKNISYQMKDFRLLGYAKQSLPDDIKIHFKDIPVEKLNRIVLILWNNGRETIHKSDIVITDKLRLSFGDSEILDAKIICTSRIIIGANIDSQDRSADEFESASTPISFDFLDHRDGMVIEVLYSPASGKNNTEPEHLGGSIKGIPEGFRKINWNPNPSISDYFSGAVMGGMMSFFSYFLATNSIYFFRSEKFISSSILGVASVIAAIFAIIGFYFVFWLIRSRPPKTLRKFNSA